MQKNYEKTPLWNGALSEEERLDYLLEELTLDEKFQCLGTGCPEIERLGIPSFGVGGEGAHGVQARHDQSYDKAEPEYTTILTNPVGMSATWDEELIYQAGVMVGNEARGLYQAGKNGNLSLWAPTIDMERDPRWGRTEEGYGEDPYLTSKMAGAYVKGLQGENPNFLRCAATLKHFYANNVEEGRTYCSSTIDLRSKHEYYLEPFRHLIQDYHVCGLMTAYNEVNGIPAMLLQDEISLAKKWGVDHVVCDGGDVSQTVDFHQYFSTHTETIAAGLKAQIDCFTDDPQMVYEAAKEAYQKGMISKKEIDAAIRNHFRVMLKLGFFEKEGRNPYEKMGMEVVSTSQNQELARKVAAESVILLKNEGMLPLNTGEKKEDNNQSKNIATPASSRGKLAVIGPLSDVWYKDWYSGVPPYAVTPLEGIKNAWEEQATTVEKMKNFSLDNVTAESDMAEVYAENALSEVKFRIDTEADAHIEGKNYLGLLDDGNRIGAVTKENAETFILEEWGEGKVTLKAKSNGKFATLEDDFQKGQKGEVTVSKEEAFGWFVKEKFYLKDDILSGWNHCALHINEEGVLCTTLENNSIQLAAEIQKDGIGAAVDCAKKADKVLLFLGSHPMITCKEEIDRTNIQLPEYQKKLLMEVAKSNKNVILVLISSVPYDISWAKENIPAIVLCATGSMELGNGLADILFGKESPAGRLNMTWYASEKDLPDITNYDLIQNPRTYQYFDKEVLYPFGYGLTYSEIVYSDLEVSISDYTFVEGKVTIENKGNQITDEVVQIYVRKNGSEVKRARRKLKAFSRVKEIAPGEKRQFKFKISLEELKYFDVISEEMLLEPGEYEVMAGKSSEDIVLSKCINLEGSKRGYREGESLHKAENFDAAVNYTLRRGHLGYTAVCTENGTDEIVLTYEKVYCKQNCSSIKLDFWKEFDCQIEIDINGNNVGKYALDVKQLQHPSVSVPQYEGQADGSGAEEMNHQWLTKHRSIGFGSIEIPLDNVPVQQEFTLNIRWVGKGKICTYQFV